MYKTLTLIVFSIQLYSKEMIALAEVKIENFPSNSIKKEPEAPPKKKIEKVVKGTVKTRKKPFMSRVRDVFVKSDDVSIKDYLIFDVIVPSIKDTVIDTIQMIFYGSKGRRRRDGRLASTGGTRISYASYYRDDDDDRKRNRDNRNSREANSIDDILFETRAEAQEVLNSLADIIDEYGSASIADFCDLCGVTEEYTDHKYGWTDVSKSTIESVRGGYFVINLPRARQIG